VLLGLCSVVTLMADRLQHRTPGTLRPRASAWYPKQRVSFSDALGWVRAHLWQKSFSMSARSTASEKLKSRWVDHLADLLCYAR
jgi:hypothetical protein